MKVMELPMLDEEEFAVIAKLNLKSTSGAPVREAYLKMTGMDESNENAIIHHRISLYGPACQYCGKPLRTPRASFCAACGKVPSVSSAEA